MLINCGTLGPLIQSSTEKAREQCDRLTPSMGLSINGETPKWLIITQERGIPFEPNQDSMK